MSPAVAGALAGLLLASGALLLTRGLLALRGMDASARLAPFIGTVHSGSVTRGPLATLLSIAAAALLPRRRAAHDASRRFDQVAAAAAGSAGGVVVGLLIAASGGAWAAPLLLGGLGLLIGALAQQRAENARAARRARIIGQQLPTVAELLAFAVAAGEPTVAAVERIGSMVQGELGAELREATSHIRAGDTTEAALRSLAERCASPEVERFVEGLLVALERGTPIADVLRAQAVDARAAERRQLVELAGRKEVGMLIPVVFLVLPTVVLIAMFPGYQALRVIVP